MNKVIPIVIALIILFVAYIGPDGLFNLINNPNVKISVYDFEFFYYPKVGGVGLRFDVALKNTSDAPAYIKELKIEPIKWWLRRGGSFPVNKTIEPNGDLTIPIQTNGQVSKFEMHNTLHTERNFKIKVFVMDSKGQSINWKQEKVSF